MRYRWILAIVAVFVGATVAVAQFRLSLNVERGGYYRPRPIAVYIVQQYPQAVPYGGGFQYGGNGCSGGQFANGGGYGYNGNGGGYNGYGNGYGASYGGGGFPGPSSYGYNGYRPSGYGYGRGGY